ncbi:MULTISPECIES: hypothetical protein [unclassified Streptomyces]|uniref:hypothetical protein n=1 Tax=unclassified Streptomyces TaxID=2593676 RepID=UPI00224D88E4|nr:MULTISPECIES: hypothetical protein [unclassified Streptomyces]MCX4969467.1 hypothetical protein [Streptomyces sp. NBC_00654]MEE1739668.1 hypothetical protein [Streptomyces sp. BE147]
MNREWDDQHAFRLLPWTGPEGKPGYVLGDGTGYVSRMADDMERVQLDMAHDLLGHAADLLADQRVTGAELHFLASRLSESLVEVKRVAESRGWRLSAIGAGPDSGSPGHRVREPDPGGR